MQFCLDAKVYIWHRETGVLLEILEGHGPGSVNSVVWHPHEASVFASCSDDRTIRIWEPESILTMDAERQLSAVDEYLLPDKGKSRPADSPTIDPVSLSWTRWPRFSSSLSLLYCTLLTGLHWIHHHLAHHTTTTASLLILTISISIFPCCTTYSFI